MYYDLVIEMYEAMLEAEASKEDIDKLKSLANKKKNIIKRAIDTVSSLSSKIMGAKRPEGPISNYSELCSEYYKNPKILHRIGYIFDKHDFDRTAQAFLDLYKKGRSKNVSVKEYKEAYVMALAIINGMEKKRKLKKQDVRKALAGLDKYASDKQYEHLDAYEKHLSAIEKQLNDLFFNGQTDSPIATLMNREWGILVELINMHKHNLHQFDLLVNKAKLNKSK